MNSSKEKKARIILVISSVQFSRSVMSDPLRLLDCSMPGFLVHHQLPEVAQTHVHIELVMPSNHLTLYHPLLSLPSIVPSIRLFWNFGFSINPSSEYSGLISFRMDWLDILAVQATLKSFLQHHGSKASILQCLAFFMVQLSHPYMTTGKTIALTRRIKLAK